MTGLPQILGWGELDARGVRGGAPGAMDRDVAWSELDDPAPGTARAFRLLFGRRDPTFRRLDRMSRALVLAVEAAGVASRIPAAMRDHTGLVVDTALGCLDADVRFAATLDDELVDGPLFAYTLPSTSLGEVALRHGLRGPTLCLSVGGGGAPGSVPTTSAWEQASAMLAAGECSHAVVARVDVLVETCGEQAMRTDARALVVARRPSGQQASSGDDQAAIAAWLAGTEARPF